MHICIYVIIDFSELILLIAKSFLFLYYFLHFFFFLNFSTRIFFSIFSFDLDKILLIIIYIMNFISNRIYIILIYANLNRKLNYRWLNYLILNVMINVTYIDILAFYLIVGKIQKYFYKIFILTITHIYIHI